MYSKDRENLGLQQQGWESSSRNKPELYTGIDFKGNPYKYVKLGNGRKMAYEIYGNIDGGDDPQCIDMVFSHGTPGYHGNPKPSDTFLKRFNIRLAAFTRPGFYESDPNYGRSIASTTKDLAEAASAVGMDNFYNFSISGGVPYAVALAAKYPERVLGSICIAGPAPIDLMGEQWGKNIVPDNAFLAEAPQDDIQRKYSLMSVQAVRHNGWGFAPTKDNPFDNFRFVPPHLTPEDRLDMRIANIEKPLQEAYEMALGKTTGGTGWLEEVAAQTKEWGITLSNIISPVSLHYYTGDHYSDVTHGEKYKEHIPNATLQILVGGHFSGYKDMHRIIENFLKPILTS